MWEDVLWSTSTFLWLMASDDIQQINIDSLSDEIQRRTSWERDKNTRSNVQCFECGFQCAIFHVPPLRPHDTTQCLVFDYFMCIPIWPKQIPQNTNEPVMTGETSSNRRKCIHTHTRTHALHARHRRVCLKMEEEVNRNSYAFFLSFFLCVLAQTVSTRLGARVCPRRYQTKTCASPKYVRIKWNWNRKANVRMDFRSSDFLFCFTFNACLRQIETLSSNEGGAKKTNLAFVLVAHSIRYNRFNENWISSWRLQSR